MSQALSPVVPRSISRPKRVAKHLSGRYPNCQLATCQATTAHLFGFKDWHALEAAIKAGQSPGPFDDELEDATWTARIEVQCAIVASELGAVDLGKSDVRPAETAAPTPMDARQFQAHMAAHADQLPSRLERANLRWGKLYAFHVLAEICPTCESSPGKQIYNDFGMKFASENLTRLPAFLGAWWKRHVTYVAFPVADIGDQLTSMPLDPNSKTSLLAFGRTWGTLCVVHARKINWIFAMGVAFLLADRFASLLTQETVEFTDMISADLPPTEEHAEALMSKFVAFARAATRYYLEAYPRDDFAEAYDKQPHAFELAAAEVIENFDQVLPNWGTWKTGHSQVG